MTTLGSYPSHRYNRPWILQRLFNKLPLWAYARRCPTSIGQQFWNPIALDLQDVTQQLANERYNSFLSTADITMLDALWRVPLLPGMEFQYTEDSSGEKTYIAPSVYATISATEYQLTQAENNNINTLAFDNLPSRIKDESVSHEYAAIIPQTYVSNLGDISPADIVIEGHVYVTLTSNTTWEVINNGMIYYPKIYLTGITRKGTTCTEAIPFRYNGTFKSVNEWQAIDSVFVSYLDSTATITLETFPHNRVSYLDNQNICVPYDDDERHQFTRLGTQTWGSTFIAESYTVSDMDIVRNVNLTEMETIYELELLDTTGHNITAVDYIHRPNSRFIYVIDASNFYVYDMGLPYPDARDMRDQSTERKMDLLTSQWINTRDAIVSINTRILDPLTVPFAYRWSLLDPDGLEYYVTSDGILVPTTTDAWNMNSGYDAATWLEQQLDITLTKSGVYVLSLECQYYDRETTVTTTLTTKLLLFTPSITPEVQFVLPVALAGATKISMDSDGKIWLLKNGYIHNLGLYFDYFLVDYENNCIWLKEEYSSVRVTI